MVKVIVPASTANLGPGFDTLGLAVKIYNTFIFEEMDNGFEMKGSMFDYNNDTNLTYVSMMNAFRHMGYSPKGIRLIMDTDIPIARGLGSSAACILGGIVGANELAGGKMTKDEIYKMAVDIEGHSDNITSQFFGGLTTSIRHKDSLCYEKISVPEGMTLCPLIPEFDLETKEARAVLPTVLNFEDAVHNVGRVAMLIATITSGDWDKLPLCFDDKLHEPYRSALIPDFQRVKDKALELGAIGAYLSGGGPTIMTIKREEDKEYVPKMQEFLSTIDNNWKLSEVEIDTEGTRIEYN